MSENKAGNQINFITHQHYNWPISSNNIIFNNFNIIIETASYNTGKGPKLVTILHLILTTNTTLARNNFQYSPNSQSIILRSIVKIQRVSNN